jgi:hypothetical protein
VVFSATRRSTVSRAVAYTPLLLNAAAVVSMWATLPASVTTVRSVGRARTLASAPVARVPIRFFSVVVEPPLAVAAMSGRIGSRVQRRNGVSCSDNREPCRSMPNSTWSETSGTSDGLPMISFRSSSPMENGFSISGPGRLMRRPYASRTTRARRASVHSPLMLGNKRTAVRALAASS